MIDDRHSDLRRHADADLDAAGRGDMDLAATGLRRLPFRASGAPVITVPYASQADAVRFLYKTRSDDHGLGLFHGPPLSGKTSIIRQFTASLPDDYAVAVVDGADTPANSLLQNVLCQFGYDLGRLSAMECFNMMKVFAIQQTANDLAPLLMVENAHALRPIAFDILCELAALDVNGKSAIRIILASDRPMLPIVRAPAMEPISKRITGEFLLRPMTRQETAAYVYKKLISGGCNDPRRVVPPEVCDGLYAASGGWPGMIDRLALLALSNAERCPLRIEHIPRQPRPADLPTGVIPLARPASKLRTGDKDDSAPQLILTCHGKTLKRTPANRPALMIGRNEHCDLRIDSDGISRHHAVLFRKGSATIIVDLKSKNGVYVNGKRTSHQLLINDDIIMLCDHRIKFIDPAARRRTTLKGAGWDETTIVQSIRAMRRHWQARRAG
jgi:pSer/pThr/pTyr-binding forkhead associated (FHA) protein